MSMWTDVWEGKTIGSALAEACDRFGSREAMIFENGAVTYDQLQEISGLAARGLLHLGVKKGDAVAFWLAGYAEWAYLYYAAARIGAVMVPVNTRYKAFEMEYVLNKSRARLLIFKSDDQKAKDYENILRELCPEIETASPATFTSKRLPNLTHISAIGGRPFPGCSSFEELLHAATELPAKMLEQAEGQVTGEDDALIQFTSGTTALPRGALLYQNAMLRAAYYTNLAMGVNEKDRFFSPQPFYHAGGSVQVMLAPVVVGCTVIVQSYFDAAGALRAMEEHRCTVTMGHQPHWIEYLNHADLEKRKLCLKKAAIIAPSDVRRRVHERLGVEVVVSPYGLTETHLGGSSCTSDDSLEKCLTTVGKCEPGLELGIRDPKSKEFLAQGGTGEVCFRGWCVMRGYYDDPDKTAEVIDAEGWFSTGDLGVVDADGYLRLVGRIKDMIRVGGENVAAADVEGFLLEHEKVKQAAVVGAAEPRLGEVVVAFIELKAGVEATEDEITSYCRKGLASFKVPRKVVFVTTWPMSGTGKIQKVALQDLIGVFGG